MARRRVTEYRLHGVLDEPWRELTDIADLGPGHWDVRTHMVPERAGWWTDNRTPGYGTALRWRDAMSRMAPAGDGWVRHQPSPDAWEELCDAVDIAEAAMEWHRRSDLPQPEGMTAGEYLGWVEDAKGALADLLDRAAARRNRP